MQNKSSITRGRLKDELNASPVFAKLTESQKDSIIDDAVRDVANYRVLNGKNDYLTDTNPDSTLVNNFNNAILNYFLNGTIDWRLIELNFDENKCILIGGIDEGGLQD